MKSIFHYLLIAILFIGLLSNSFSQSEHAPFAIRGWVLLDYNMPYLRKMIPLAAKEGINHLQLCHRIGMQLSDYLEPERNKNIRELIDLAHKHGIKAYVWTHELDEVPSEFIHGAAKTHTRQQIGLENQIDKTKGSYVQGAKVAAYGDAFWDWMGQRYQKLLDALPEVDGVVVTLTETNVPIDDDNLVVSPLSPPQRFVKMAEKIYDVVHPRGKELILRTFTWIEEDYDWMLQAFQQLPKDIVIMSKVNWGDWYQHYPANPFIGKVAPHRQIVEFDLVGQYHGDTLVPWVCAEFLQQQMQYDLSQHASGVIARVDWSGHVYGSANEFNAVAYAQLAQNPHLNLDELWNAWAEKKFGAEAAPFVVSALKRTNEIANLIFFTRSFKIFKSSGTLISLSYMDGTRIMHSLFCRDVQSRWKPELIPIANELLNPTLATMQKSIAEKERAIALIDESLKDLQRAKPFMQDESYVYLTTLFRNERLLARCWRWINEAYFRYVFLHKGDQSQKEPLGLALNEIDTLREEVVHCFGDRIYLMQPERMTNLVGDIRTLVSEPVKWFAPCNSESMHKPVLFDINGDGVDEVIVNGRDNRLHAFAEGGTEVWHYDTFGLRVRYPNISDPASLDCDGDGDNELLIGAADGDLYAFTTRGELMWKFQTGNAIVSAPVALKKTAKPITVCASLDGYLYGIDAIGKQVWKSDLSGVVSTNLLRLGDRVVVGTQDGLVRAFNSLGGEIWRYDLGAPMTGALALHTIDGEKIITTASGPALVLLKLDGSMLDAIKLPSEDENIVVAACSVYQHGQPGFIVGTDKGSVYGLGNTGDVLFEAKLGQTIQTPAVELESKEQSFFLVGVDNAVVAINERGEEVWRFTAAHNAVIGSELLVSNEKNELLFTAGDRKLYVIDLQGLVRN